ncbi:hypothetical protein OG871_39780 (plasmid) [Kitasatospora sp. NBC_00374]|uniref:RapZ C-terminal domain-containing protein n=1 Tax=Kitasatospora sp. NBC_00374 TaxID=2975964 RepID=UPI002F90B6DA
MSILDSRARLALNPEGTEARYGHDHVIRGVVQSFGYGHRPLAGSREDRCARPVCRHVPRADLCVDATVHYRNPHTDPRMRELTGLDDEVLQHVLDTPGAAGSIDAAVTFTANLLYDVANRKMRMVRVAVGCVGGRHRSVAMAEEIAHQLWLRHGFTLDVEHLDVRRPVIQP